MQLEVAPGTLPLLWVTPSSPSPARMGSPGEGRGARLEWDDKPGWGQWLGWDDGGDGSDGQDVDEDNQRPRGKEAAAASRRDFWLSLCCKKVLWFARSLVRF